MQIEPILGYFWAIFGQYQPPGPPLWVSAPPFYISWIRPCILIPEHKPTIVIKLLLLLRQEHPHTLMKLNIVIFGMYALTGF